MTTAMQHVFTSTYLVQWAVNSNDKNNTLRFVTHTTVV